MVRAKSARSNGGEWLDAQLRALAGSAVSDASLDPLDDGSYALVVREHGVLRPCGHCPVEAAAEALARLKALAQLPAYITEECQDGRIDGRPFGLSGDLRVAILPTVRGGRAAIRLPALDHLPRPEELGLEAEDLPLLRGWLDEPDGLVLLSGPTGSGKTTTAHSLIVDLLARRHDRRIVTIEDPVERRLAGVHQVEIKPHLQLDFAAALRAALRQDADVIVVGEVRDLDTARTAVQAALAGHLVLASLHVPRAAEVPARLLDMGISQAQLAPVLRGVLAQRLLRLRHAACGGAGCKNCAGGYAGRQMLYDLLPVPRPHPDGADWLHRLPLRRRMQDGAKVLLAEGHSDVAEVQRVLGGNALL